MQTVEEMVSAGAVPYSSGLYLAEDKYLTGGFLGGSQPWDRVAKAW
jgi:hypothetical protein